jgi:hypothetical protein
LRALGRHDRIGSRTATEIGMRNALTRRAAAAGGALLLAGVATSRLRAQTPEDAVTPQSIDRRLERRAADLEKNAPQGADRYILFDLAYPQDPEEYRAVGKTALVLVVAISKRSDELPLRRVFTRIGAKDFDLPKLGGKRSETQAGSQARALFGPYREDAFYLAPIGALLRENLLICDFARNRTGFFINRAPLTPPDFIRDDRERDKAGTAQDAAVKAFAAREFPGFGVLQR